MYSQFIIDKFTNPKNSGYMKNADCAATVGNADASDVIKMFFKVENNKIVDAKFKAFGCVIAIVSADIVIDLILNKTLEQASKLSIVDVIDVLGEIDDEKRACISVAVETLHQTLEDYKERQELEREKQENGGKVKRKKK